MAKIKCNVISYTLMRTVDFEVILPSVTIPESMFNQGDVHHDYRHKYPVVYLLHGFGNNQSQWGGYTNVELYAEERQIAVVMISGENKNYVDQGADQFSRFINGELQEYITGVFPISTRREDTYIAGLSMGGFGALYNGLTHIDKYQAIGAFSPALRMQNITIDMFEILANLERAPQLFIACGEDDFVYEDTKEFVLKIQEKQLNLTWLSVKDYGHEWRFWDQCVEKFLDTIDRSDHYANQKRKV